MTGKALILSDAVYTISPQACHRRTYFRNSVRIGLWKIRTTQTIEYFVILCVVIRADKLAGGYAELAPTATRFAIAIGGTGIALVELLSRCAGYKQGGSYHLREAHCWAVTRTSCRAMLVVSSCCQRHLNL